MIGQSMKRIKTSIWILVICTWLLIGCKVEGSAVIPVTPVMSVESTLAATLTQTIPAGLPDESGNETQMDSLDFSYTADKPLTDPDEILNILHALSQKYIQWLSRPGWFLERTYINNGSVLTATHFIDDQGNCAERFQFSEHENQWSASWLRMVDGTNVQLYDQPRPLVEAKNPPVISSPKPGDSCKLENDVAYDLINLESGKKIRIEDFQNGVFTSHDLNLWNESLDGREVVVLFENAVYAEPRPTIWKPESGGWVLVQRDQSWLYFDLQSGGIIGRRNVGYYDKGEVVDGDETKIWKTDLLFELTLPFDIDDVFEETSGAIKEYIQKLEK